MVQVWTGTTYGLAAAMIHESNRGEVSTYHFYLGCHDTMLIWNFIGYIQGVNAELFKMGINTARGIHDAGSYIL